MSYSAVLHKLGYIEAMPKPSSDVLKKHYEDKYYQDAKGTYAPDYCDDELIHFANIAKAAQTTARNLDLPNQLLDLGCGEGFFAKYFFDADWEVSCADYSTFGISKHNPELMDYFIAGDIYTSIERLITENATFGMVNLQNVLEHVIDPLALLMQITPLIKSNGALRIRVPNDYSAFQLALLDRDMTYNTWFNAPEHLSYFNKDGLTNVLNEAGYKILSMQADFPIELFLANPHSNYWSDRDLGKGAHFTRVFCENHLIESDIDNYLKYSEAAGALGFGRELVVYASTNAT